MNKFSVLYLYNNSILYLKDEKSKLVEYKLTKFAIKNGRIEDPNLFSKALAKILYKNKKISIFGNNSIKVVINELCTYADKFFLSEILKDYDFNKVKFIYEKNILEENSQNIYLNLCNGYYTVYYFENNIVKTVVTVDNFIDYKSVVEKIKENNSDKIIFIANNTGYNIKDMSNKCYIYCNFNEFLLKKLYCI